MSSEISPTSKTLSGALPFVYCAKCYNTTHAIALFYTSCGHILCSDHLSSKNRCAACNTRDISTYPLSERVNGFKSPRRMHRSIRGLFKSFLPGLENIHSIARYQYSRLVQLVEHQSRTIGGLENKVDELKSEFNSVVLKAKKYKS